MIDAGGTMWILIAVIGAVLLALGLFYASQQAKDAPRDAVTLRLKREKPKENYSVAAVEKKPVSSEAGNEEAAPKKKRRPRIGKQAPSRRRETHPPSHTTH